MKCILVDDEPLALAVLEKHIRRYGGLELAGKCLNALEAFDLLHREAIDLVFLDIRMPSISGLDFLKSLKLPPKVIFTTAYPEYAHEGFEADAIDYLVKPISYERFERSMQKLFRLAASNAAEPKDYTYFKVSGKLVKVLHPDLLYAQSVGDYLLLYTRQDKLIVHMTMKYLESLLPAERFVRTHRSYLVNAGAVEVAGREAVQVGNTRVPLSARYKDALIGLLKKS